MNILVVDDDPVSRLVLEGALSAFGHAVTQASDGREAWDAIVESPPQVLIADWMMPELDGLELCRLVRGHDSVRYVYVILLTSRRDKEDRLEGLRAGADDFLVKPLDRGELAARLSVAERILRVEDELRQANADLAEARHHELEIGAEIQRALLTGQVPESANSFRFAALTIPSRQIDGDFYDVFVHTSEVVDVVIGDAMGKGIPAALVSAGTKNAILRSLNSLLSASGDLPPIEKIVQRANDEVASRLIRLNSFVTLAYARFDSGTRSVRLVDCGHTKVVVWRRTQNKPELLQGAGNFPLGFQENERYAAIEASLDTGDVLMFYSDGVTEAPSPSGELFGVDRLLEVLQQAQTDPPDLVVMRLRQAVYRHTRHRPLSDDLTCLVVECFVPKAPWVSIEDVYPSDMDELWALREFVEYAATSCELSEKATQELQLAVHEAATNIVRHAHYEDAGRTIQVVATRVPGGVRIELWYAGPPFIEPDSVEPDFDNLQGHGLGLFLIRESVDHVRYAQVGNRNMVALTKHF